MHNHVGHMHLKFNSPHQVLTLNFSGNDKFLVWHTFADFTEEEARFEQLAARFKTAEVASQFKEAFVEVQNNLGKVS